MFDVEKFKNYIQKILEKKTLYTEDLDKVLAIWEYITSDLEIIRLKILEIVYKEEIYVYFVQSNDNAIYKISLSLWNNKDFFTASKIFYFVNDSEKIRKVLQGFLNALNELKI